jgi:hypothetical protein
MGRNDYIGLGSSLNTVWSNSLKFDTKTIKISQNLSGGVSDLFWGQHHLFLLPVRVTPTDFVFL